MGDYATGFLMIGLGFTAGYLLEGMDLTPYPKIDRFFTECGFIVIRVLTTLSQYIPTILMVVVILLLFGIFLKSVWGAIHPLPNWIFQIENIWMLLVAFFGIIMIIRFFMIRKKIPRPYRNLSTVILLLTSIFASFILWGVILLHRGERLFAIFAIFIGTCSLIGMIAQLLNSKSSNENFFRSLQQNSVTVTTGAAGYMYLSTFAKNTGYFFNRITGIREKGTMPRTIIEWLLRLFYKGGINLFDVVEAEIKIEGFDIDQVPSGDTGKHYTQIPYKHVGSDIPEVIPITIYAEIETGLQNLKAGYLIKFMAGLSNAAAVTTAHDAEDCNRAHQAYLDEFSPVFQNFGTQTIEAILIEEARDHAQSQEDINARENSRPTTLIIMNDSEALAYARSNKLLSGGFDIAFGQEGRTRLTEMICDKFTEYTKVSVGTRAVTTGQETEAARIANFVGYVIPTTKPAVFDVSACGELAEKLRTAQAELAVANTDDERRRVLAKTKLFEDEQAAEGAAAFIKNELKSVKESAPRGLDPEYKALLMATYLFGKSSLFSSPN